MEKETKKENNTGIPANNCADDSCDGGVVAEKQQNKCNILELFHGFAERIEDVVSYKNAKNICEYIQILEDIVRRHHPMKPKTDNLDEQDTILCPACGNGLMPADGDDYFETPQYCSKCGQFLQWNGKTTALLRHIAIPCEPDAIFYGVSDDCIRVIAYKATGFEFPNGNIHIILVPLDSNDSSISVSPSAIGNIIFATKREAESYLIKEV